MQYGPGFVPSPSSAFAPTDRGSILAGLRRSVPLASAPARFDYQSPPLAPAVYPGSGPQQQHYTGNFSQASYNEQMEMNSAMQQLRLQTSAEFDKLAQRQAEIAVRRRARHSADGQSMMSPSGGSPAWSPPQQQYAGYPGYQSPQSGYDSGYQGFDQNYDPGYDQPRRTFGAAAIESVLARQSPSQAFGYDYDSPQMMGSGPIGTPRANAQSPLSFHSDPYMQGPGPGVLGLGAPDAYPSPQLVLSKPGETYPPIDMTRNGHLKRDSGSSSSASESFDSAATSVSAGLDAFKVASPTLVLNPGAAAFSPKTITPVPTPAPAADVQPRQRVPLALASRRAAQQAANAVTITRQPRGAISVDEPEFATHNFASRIRQQGRQGLGLLGRRVASPVHESYVLARRTVADPAQVARMAAAGQHGSAQARRLAAASPPSVYSYRSDLVLHYHRKSLRRE